MKLHGWQLTPAFFDELATRVPSPALKSLTFESCDMPLEPAAERAVIAAIARAAHSLRGVELQLPCDAQDHVAVFAAAGLRCSFEE